MAIHEVDMTKALTNKQYAQQVLRSGKCDDSQKIQLRNKWGEDFVNEVMAKDIDTTQYQIDDTKKSAAKATGTQRAKEGAQKDQDGNVNNEGFDGKADNAKSAGGTAAAVTASTAGACVAATSTIIAVITTKSKEVPKGFASGWVAAACGAVLLAVSLMLKALNPNADQAQACDNMQPVLQEADGELQDLGEETSEVTEDITDATDELAEVDEDFAKDQEDKEKQYEKLVQEQQELLQKYEASKTGGEPFTEDDKARLDSLNQVLPVMHEQIVAIKADGDEQKGELTETIEDSQETYDTLGEKIEEVRGMTEEQAQYDQATVDNAGMVKTAARIGQVASGVTAAAGATHLWKWFSGEAFAGAAAVATGGAALMMYGQVANAQSGYQDRAQAGVDKRVETEELNAQTTESYEADLETYAENIEVTDGIEFEETEFEEPTIVTVGAEDENANKAGKEDDNKPGSEPETKAPLNNSPAQSPSVKANGEDNNNPFANKDKDKDPKEV